METFFAGWGEKVKVVGIYRELGRGISQSLPSIHSAIGMLPSEQVALVVDYLNRGVIVFDVMGTTIDPLDSSVCMSGGASLASDGVWVWRLDLAYFVEKYRVGLPNEFLAHIKTNSHAPLLDTDIVSRWGEAVDSYSRAEKGG